MGVKSHLDAESLGLKPSSLTLGTHHDQLISDLNLDEQAQVFMHAVKAVNCAKVCLITRNYFLFTC